MSRARPHSLLGSLLALVVLVVSCHPSDDAAAAPPPPSVILISLDTVRADNLSAYGGPGGATPALDAFAAGATRYAVCVSAAPWTLPSHASMFTGLYPFEHGAHTFLPGEGHRGDNVFALNPRFETLAESLSRVGYRTAGIVANTIYLRPELGLDAGFKVWDVQRDTGARVTERALAWLDESSGGDRPAFLFVNYMDAHRPYAAGAEGADAGAAIDALIDRVMARGEDPAAEGDRVRGLHQTAVTILDGHLERLFDGLRERGLFDDALIIVTSDHGEAFGAHGLVEHSKDVYEDLVRVPLLVKTPGQTVGDVIHERASSVDIPGLVAAALAEGAHHNLVATYPRRPGNHPVLVENYYSRFGDLARFGQRFRRRRTALYDGRWKLIAGSDGSLELYDVATDRAESFDVAVNDAGEQTPRVATLLERLQSMLSKGAYAGERVLPGQLTPAQVQDLAALGYAGGAK